MNLRAIGQGTELDKFQQDKCHVCEERILFGQAYFVMDANSGANAAGSGNWKKVHSDCGPNMPSFVRSVSSFKRDAERFRYLQNLPVVEAQAYFWNYGSRTERAKAIDAAMNRLIEGNVP